MSGQMGFGSARQPSAFDRLSAVEREGQIDCWMPIDLLNPPVQFTVENE
ncbi:MAG: hypothetical protein HC827_14170 [Cyanobacteria bacterium RM1_2_2]|nr:hypothetical protein [Cyanobacteria bacterium RM1_2_2]